MSDDERKLTHRQRWPRRDRWDPQRQARRGGRGLPLLAGRPGERLAVRGVTRLTKFPGPGPASEELKHHRRMEIQMRRR